MDLQEFVRREQAMEAYGVEMPETDSAPEWLPAVAAVKKSDIQ